MCRRLVNGNNSHRMSAVDIKFSFAALYLSTEGFFLYMCEWETVGLFVILRWTSCRCMCWRWRRDQANLFSTWSITSRASTSNTTPTPASWGTTTSDSLHRWAASPFSIRSDRFYLTWTSQLHWKKPDALFECFSTHANPQHLPTGALWKKNSDNNNNSNKRRGQ